MQVFVIDTFLYLIVAYILTKRYAPRKQAKRKVN
jgi:hypothetical protein